MTTHLTRKHTGLEHTVTVWIPIIVLVLMISFALFLLVQQDVSGREIRNPLGSAGEQQYRFALDIAEEVKYRNALNKIGFITSYPYTPGSDVTVGDRLVESAFCRGAAGSCLLDFDAVGSGLENRIRQALWTAGSTGTGAPAPPPFRFALNYGPDAPWEFQSSSQSYESGPARFYYLFPLPGRAGEINLVIDAPSEEIFWRRR